MSTLGMYRELVVAYDNRINDLLKYGELHALCYSVGSLCYDTENSHIDTRLLTRTFKVAKLMLSLKAFTFLANHQLTLNLKSFAIQDEAGCYVCKMKDCAHIGQDNSEWSFVYISNPNKSMKSSWSEYQELSQMLREHCPCDVKTTFIRHKQCWEKRFTSSLTARYARAKAYLEYEKKHNAYKYKTIALAESITDNNAAKRNIRDILIKVLTRIIAAALSLYITLKLIQYFPLDTVRYTIKNVFSGITQ